MANEKKDWKQYLRNIGSANSPRWYMEVKYRVLWFRDEFPIGAERPGRIETERVPGTDGRVAFEARVYVGDALVATGHAEETLNMKTSNFGGRVVEKIETGAIGRALGLCGFGTEASFEGDEEDENGDPFIADTPHAPQNKRRSTQNGRKSAQKGNGQAKRKAPARAPKEPKPVERLRDAYVGAGFEADGQLAFETAVLGATIGEMEERGDDFDAMATKVAKVIEFAAEEARDPSHLAALVEGFNTGSESLKGVRLMTTGDVRRAFSKVVA